jgi:mitochondrial import receptor subunit TOM20
MEWQEKFILTTLTVLAGACMGYCMYLDWKGSSDPEGKKKLREERRTAPRVEETTLPNLEDREAVQRFFVKEFQLGKELLDQGKIEDAVEHLCHAVAVCTQPQVLLQAFQQELPPQVFRSILERLPKIGHRLVTSLNRSG